MNLHLIKEVFKMVVVLEFIISRENVHKTGKGAELL